MGVTVTQKYRQTFRGSVPFPILHASCGHEHKVRLSLKEARVISEHPCITCLAREQAVSSEHTLGLGSRDG